LVRVRIEVPRWSWTKRKADGAVDLRSPLPCPYNYGSILDTEAPDGDPLDALVLGPRLRFGDIVSVPARAVVRFFDEGVADPKIVCSAEPISRAQRRGIMLFFVTYAAFKRARQRVRGRPGYTAHGEWMTLAGRSP
jgi:inorganic pyrophosphatase